MKRRFDILANRNLTSILEENRLSHEERAKRLPDEQFRLLEEVEFKQFTHGQTGEPYLHGFLTVGTYSDLADNLVKTGHLEEIAFRGDLTYRYAITRKGIRVLGLKFDLFVSAH